MKMTREQFEEKLKTDEEFRWLNEIANKQLSRYVRKVRSNNLSDCYIDISTINNYFDNTLTFKIYQEDMVFGNRYLKAFRNDTLIFVATADYGTDKDISYYKGISYYLDEFDESIMVNNLEYDEINYLIRLMKHQIRINVDVEIEEIMVEVEDK